MSTLTPGAFDVAAALLTREDWEELAARFWAAIDRRGPDDCWPCKNPNRNGYGVMHVKGHNVGLHRLGFLVQFGTLDPLLDVLHSCDFPPCGNGGHLRQGTHAENMADRERKHRRIPAYGTRVGSAKLADGEAREVCDLYATGEFSQRALAARFNVSQPAIQYIIAGKAWRRTLAGESLCR